MKRRPTNCPAEITIHIIVGRWKLDMLWHLLQNKKQPAALKKALPGISEKMLFQQLRELENDHLIKKTVISKKPRLVEYSLTPIGKSLKGVVNSVHRWGETHASRWSLLRDNI